MRKEGIKRSLDRLQRLIDIGAPDIILAREIIILTERLKISEDVIEEAKRQLVEAVSEDVNILTLTH